jgi:hypothetical protein
VVAGDYLVGAGSGNVRPVSRANQRQAANGTNSIGQTIALNWVVENAADIFVFVGGALVAPTTNYTVATALGVTTLTAVTAFAAGTNNVVIVNPNAAPAQTPTRAVEVPVANGTQVIALLS